MAKAKTIRKSRNSSTAGIPSSGLRALLVAAIKQVWRLYDENRKLSKDRAKVRRYGFNKDGSISKRYTIAYMCANCKQIVEKTDTDHIKPVGKQPPWPPSGKGEWDRYLIDQFTSLDNLQELCKDCHKRKSAHEKTTGAYL